MARETVAARNARLEAERLAAEAEARAAYPARLMATLERVSNIDELELRVVAREFVITNRNDSYQNDFVLGYEYNTDNQAMLENLEYWLIITEREKAEARRRVEVKKEAERKVRELLTDEERQLLGLFGNSL